MVKRVQDTGGKTAGATSRSWRRLKTWLPVLPSDSMPHEPFDLVALARQEMTDEGFQPDFAPDAQQQLAAITLQPDHSLRDLTGLLWSSIDNDDSRDLDQIEWAERVATGIRVLRSEERGGGKESGS